MQVVPRLKMLRWIFFFIVFLSSLHIVVTRLSKVKSVYAEGKKIRESAGSIEIENVAIDFPFHCISIKFVCCCYTFIYGEICLCRKTGIIFIRHLFCLFIMRRE